MVSKVVVVSSVVVGDSRVHSPHISDGKQLHKTRKNYKRVEIYFASAKPLSKQTRTGGVLGAVPSAAV